MKCKKVQIGIFFDGTGNHKEKDKEKGQESNIAKLSELYCKGQLTNWSNEWCYYYADMIYVPGVGTGAGLDKIRGGAAGDGGAKRIDDVIKQLNDMLKDKGGKYPAKDSQNQDVYRERIIDVFGFSRGAALARDFINTFNTRNKFTLKLKNITFNFVGLYDTVGSFNEAGDDINIKPKENSGNSEDDYWWKSSNDNNKFFEYIVKTAKNEVGLKQITAEMNKTKDGENPWTLDGIQKTNNTFPYVMRYKRIIKGYEEYNFNLAGYSANNIVHMVASHEVRKNFPLSSTNGTGVEWVYAGVHSDIGGGYAPSVTEHHGREVTFKEPRLAIKEIEKMKASKQIPAHANVEYERPSEYSYQTVAKITWDREVSNDLSFVTLFRMYEQAIKSKVPLMNMTYKMPSTMNQYNAHTKSSPNQAMSYEKMDELKEKFFHHSAVDQLDLDTHYDGNILSADVIGANDTNYVNGKPKRAIYTNKPHKAIKPFIVEIRNKVIR